MDDTCTILSRMRDKGVTLWIDNDRLCYRASKVALTSAEVASLRAMKDEIMSRLEQPRSIIAAEPPLVPRAPGTRIPLTYTQQWWLNSIQRYGVLGRIRYVASAVRVTGDLQIEYLRKSFHEIVKRHESLRTRIVIIDEVPMQEIDQVHEHSLEVIDLTAISQSIVEPEARRLVDEVVFATAGPLFAARLLKLSAQEYVLVMAMHHVISDGISLQILDRDIWTIYHQAANGIPCTLPPIPIQYADYAIWQRASQSSWMHKHQAYWRERLNGAHRAQFPAAQKIAQGERCKIVLQPIEFGPELSDDLRAFSRRERTTLVMAVLAAYVTFILRRQGKTDLVIRFLATGRDLPQIQNVIGLFACLLYLRIELKERDTFADILKRVTEEFSTASEHNDAGRTSSEVDGADFKLGTCFNWHTGGDWSVSSKLQSGSDMLKFSSFPITSPFVLEWDSDKQVPADDPGLNLFDTSAGVAGAISYRADLFGECTMDRLSRDLLSNVRELVRQPYLNVATLPLVR